ncbi:MAG: lytic transglycosylase domain-containing protein, partial [Thermonemataceae bacterium]|nr:lytic transglycosylase domain-containing protein [Thermonemataceae bacterium]
ITLWILVIGLIAYTILDKWLNKPETSSYQDGSFHQTQLVNFQIPEGLSFAGEFAPTKRVDIRQRLDREYYAFIFGHAGTALTLRKAKQWLPIFEKILKEKGVHEDFKFLPIIESNLSNAVSPAGAAGFWQIMPEVAKYYGLEISEEVDERYHPIKSAYVAATILKENYQKFGSWALAAAAYNAGAGYLEGVVNYQKSKSYYDLYLYPETSRYVIRLLAFKDIYQNAAKYGFAIKEDKFYYLEATKELKITESIEDLAIFATEQGITYQKLLELNPWLKAKSLHIKEGKSYYIALPISAQPHKKST